MKILLENGYAKRRLQVGLVVAFPSLLLLLCLAYVLFMTEPQSQVEKPSLEQQSKHRGVEPIPESPVAATYDPEPYVDEPQDVQMRQQEDWDALVKAKKEEYNYKRQMTYKVEARGIALAERHAGRAEWEKMAEECGYYIYDANWDGPATYCILMSEQIPPVLDRDGEVVLEINERMIFVGVVLVELTPEGTVIGCIKPYGDRDIILK